MQPPRKLMRRRDLPGTARFLTFSCLRRLRLFDNDRIKTRFVDALTAAAGAHQIAVLAWVVMPEHVHLVIKPNGPTPLSRFLQALKQPVARDVLSRWKSLDAPILTRVATPTGMRFWEPGGGYDRNVIGEELVEKIRYVHRNPVTRGLAPETISWPWSSAAWYAGCSDALGPPIALDLLGLVRDDLL